MALPLSTGMKVGIGILVLAVVLIGIGTIMRTSKMPTPAEEIPALVETAQMPTVGGMFPTSASSTVEESTATEPITPAEKIVVSYTGTEFIPAVITVKVGTTVLFENESGQAMWPASNPHPIHTDLPGFDGGQKIEAGGTYSYTFTKVGTWKYHNHLRADAVGTVIVTP